MHSAHKFSINCRRSLLWFKCFCRCSYIMASRAESSWWVSFIGKDPSWWSKQHKPQFLSGYYVICPVCQGHFSVIYSVEENAICYGWRNAALHTGGRSMKYPKHTVMLCRAYIPPANAAILWAGGRQLHWNALTAQQRSCEALSCEVQRNTADCL